MRGILDKSKLTHFHKFYVMCGAALVTLFTVQLYEPGPHPGGGDSHMKQTEMLVGNFEFNP